MDKVGTRILRVKNEVSVIIQHDMLPLCIIGIFELQLQWGCIE